jgi:hypothetical protein
LHPALLRANAGQLTGCVSGYRMPVEPSGACQDAKRPSGYDVGMQRLLISIAVTLLLVVSIAVGVAVARWPHLWR